MTEFDAVVVGSGPNGLAAAITLAQQGASVKLIEGHTEIGGGTRTSELTLPGFLHDVCSAIHPLGELSPFFKGLPLEKHGLEWIHSPIPLAHPLDNGQAIIADRSIARTAELLAGDEKSYIRVVKPFVAQIRELAENLLSPTSWPSSPSIMAKYYLQGGLPATAFAKLMFRSEEARALFAGMAAHSVMPLNKPGTTAFGLMFLAMVHAVGWPMAKGGSRSISKAMESYLIQLGGEVSTGWQVASLEELPSAKAYLFDVAPNSFVNILGDNVPASYRGKLENYSYGPGVFKVDYALSQAIPWTNSQCHDAATLHLGGSMSEIAQGEARPWQKEAKPSTFVLLAQQSQFDPSRAPIGKHTAWAYCHVPNGSSKDMTSIIENQIERFAPGFRDCVLSRNKMTAQDFQAYNPNYVGGDISGGANTISQLLARPALQLFPYRTPIKNVYMCSASTPPGGGVHGMSGYHAAKSAIKFSL